MRALLIAALAFVGFHSTVMAAAPCSPFTSFPLTLNFGSGANTGSGEDLNCALRKVQAAVNAASITQAAPTFPGAVTALDTITAPGTGAVWTSIDPAFFNTYGIPIPAKVGAKIHRLNDRLLVGAATKSSGEFPPVTRDWYEELEAGETHPGGFRTSWAQTASISTNGGIGVLGAARTSDIQLPTFQLAMGGLFASHNNNTTAQQLATALYAVTFRDAGAGTGLNTGSVAFEADIQNKGNSLKLTPANVDDPRGHTTAAKLNSGAAVPGSNAASAALTFGNNRGTFLSGLIVAQNAIEGVAVDTNNKATGGEGEAIGLGAFHNISWWVTGGAAPAAKIISRQLAAANQQEISFEDGGIFMGGPVGNGRGLRVVYPGGATGAYVAMTPASGANPAIIQTAGQANADLALSAAGTGQLVLGSIARLKLVTVAALPPCVIGLQGAMAAVSDASGTPTYNAAVVGGGANSMPVYCNGNTWTMH